MTIQSYDACQANWICWKFSIGSGLLSTDHIHWREANMTENFWSSKSKVDWRQQIKQSGNVQLPDLHIYHLSTSCPNESARIKMILYDDSLQQVVPWWCPVLHVPRRRSTPTTMSTMRSANSGSDDVCAFPKNKKKKTAFRSIPTPPMHMLKIHIRSRPHHCILLYQHQDTPNLCTTTCWYSSGAQRNCNIEATFAGADPSGLQPHFLTLGL